MNYSVGTRTKRSDKKNSSIVLLKEPEAVVNTNDCVTDGPVRDINSKLLINNDER